MGKKIGRYLCLSKTEGISDYIVVNIDIINEKDGPPDGYCLISKTIDSGIQHFIKLFSFLIIINLITNIHVILILF